MPGGKGGGGASSASFQLSNTPPIKVNVTPTKLIRVRERPKTIVATTIVKA